MAITIRTASPLGGGASVPDATTTTKGKVRLATIAEASGSSQAIAVTPAGLQAEIGGIVGGMNYKGLWDAVNAVPDLSNALRGDFYKISAAGERYGQDWQINDHLIINEDMGGSIVNSRIDKIDNTEQVAELNDLTDVTITSQASGEVLKYDGSAWINAALTPSDVAGVATDADLTTLEGRVTVNEGDISSLEPRVTTNEGNISAIQTEVNRIEVAAGISTSGSYIVNTSANYINAAFNLNNADVILDQQVKVNADAIVSNTSSLQSEINAIETGAGLSSSGVYIPDPSADYISTASSLKNADSLLDDKLKETRDLVDAVVSSTSSLQVEINTIETGAGLNSNGSYTPDATADYISTASSLKNADSLLDDKLKETRDLVDSLGASSVSSVNSISPVAGDVTVGGADIDSAHTATNYTATSSDLDGHLAGVDTALGLKANSASLATVATTGAYADLSGSPALATVATSGLYTDLSSLPTLGTASAEDVGTSTGDVVQLVDVGGSAGLPVVDGSQLTGITADLTNSVINDMSDVTITTASANQVLKYDGSAWVNSSVAYAEVTGTPSLGTASAEDVGVAIGDVVQLEDVGGSAALPAVDGSQLTGLNIDSVNNVGDVTVTTPSAGDALIYDDVSSEWQNQALATVATSGEYADLLNKPTLGTASAEDVGVAIGDVVQLVDVGGSAGLPVVDGSQLTGITADLTNSVIDDMSDVTITTASANQVLKYDGSVWINSSVAYTEVTGTPNLATVATSGEYADLLNKPTLGTASAEDVGVAIGDVVQLVDVGGSAALPAVDGSQLTGLNIDSVGDLGDVTITTPAAGDALIYDDVSSEWQNQALATVATSGAYSDLSGTPTLGTASAEDVGTSAGNVIQLNGSAQLPAVDGSLLTGITADVSTASIGALVDVTVTTPSAGDALIYDDVSSEWLNQALATVATTGAAADVSGLATVATSGEYADLLNKPTLATVATSGEYADLLNKPTLGTASAQNVEAFAQTANNLSDLASASTARTNLGLGSASVLNAGTSANNVVQLNGSAQLPAVDGSLLTGITADVSTASIGGLADVTITSAANGDALVYDGTKWRDLALATVATSGAAADVSGLANVATTGAYSDLTGAPALATVATTGSYDDLSDAPTSMIGSAQFITDANALTLQAGKHYIIGTANATTKTMTLPDVTASGEYIRVTNWGDGQLVIQVDQVSSSAYLLVGNTIVQNGQVTIESRATVDLFGFDYTPAGYEPAWGVYFSSSIETNTRSFSTTGQLPVYDATAGELKAGDLGDLTFAYTPTNYTTAGNGVSDHFEGVDNELGALDTAITTLDGLAVKSINTLTPTAGAVTLGGVNIDTAHVAINYTAAAADIDSHLAGIDTEVGLAVKSINTLTPTAGDITIGGANIDTAHVPSDYSSAGADLDSNLAGIDARLAEKVNAADGLNGLDDVDLTTSAPQDGEILIYNATSSLWEPNPPPAPLATETSVGLVELATDAETTAGTSTDVVLRPSNISSIEISDLLNAGSVVTLDVGTSANNVVQLDGSAKLPAVDGSALTGVSVAAPPVTAATSGTITVPTGSEAYWLMSPTSDTSVTLNSPTAGAPGTGDDGKKVGIKNTSAFELTINGSIDGGSSFVLDAENSAITLIAYNGSWLII
jgi:hypothetical protein